MTKPIPAKPAGPTAAELRTRRTTLTDQIGAADAACREALADYDAALTEFGANETDETSRQLSVSEQRVQSRERRRAELLAELAAHDGAIRVAERGESEQRGVTIRTELADNQRMQELASEATMVVATLVESLLKIREHNVERQKLRTELLELETSLGVTPTESAVGVYSRGVEAHWGFVAAGLRELAQGETDTARRGYMLALAHAPIDLRTF